MTRPELTLSFDPATIQHLGPKLYSRLPDAIAELVANAYDADADAVLVAVRRDSVGGEFIEVTDDGHGMTPTELDKEYLTIGRDRREVLGELSRSRQRQVSGKKGLGKLALFGIGHEILLTTVGQNDATRTKVKLVWEDILQEKSRVYSPGVVYDDYDGPTGTSVRISALQRKTDVSAKQLALALARLVLYADDGFELWIEDNEGARVQVTPELRKSAYQLEREIRVPDDLPSDGFEELRRRGVVGWVGLSESTLPSQNRGVTLYARKRRVTLPSFFDAPATNFAYAYIVGEIEADYLDLIKPDVIATARNRLNWEHPDTVALRSDLTDLVKFAADERRRIKKEQSRERTKRIAGVDRELWLSTVRSGPERAALAAALDVAESTDTDYGEGEQEKLVEALKIAIPEYPDFHWRHLDESIKSIEVETAYFEERYDDALLEAVKLLSQAIKSRLPELKSLDGHKLFEHAFHTNQTPRLEVVDTESVVDGYLWSEETRVSVQVGLQMLGKGLYSYLRTPLSHEVKAGLFETGVLSYEDCLDGLSVASALARVTKSARRVTT